MTELLITGASGFVGTAVTEYLAGSDIHTMGVSLRNGIPADLDLSAFDAVLHAAGIAHVDAGKTDPREYDRVNHLMTIELAKRAKSAGVRQFIYLSSMIVFGQAAPVGKRLLITPNTAPAPINAYGQSKLDAENDLAELADDNFKVIILRPPMVYGKGCKGNYRMLAKLARLTPCFPDFINQRSTLYIGNLCACIEAAVRNNLIGCFHPRDGRPVSVSDVVRAITAARSKKVLFTKLLNPFVRLFGFIPTVRRAFGDMAYSDDMPDLPCDYRIFDTVTAIKTTEADHARS